MSIAVRGPMPPKPNPKSAQTSASARKKPKAEAPSPAGTLLQAFLWARPDAPHTNPAETTGPLLDREAYQRSVDKEAERVKMRSEEKEYHDKGHAQGYTWSGHSISLWLAARPGRFRSATARHQDPGQKAVAP